MTTPTIRDALDTFQQAANSGTAVYLSPELVEELRKALDAESEGPSDEQIANLADEFYGDPVPTVRRALELWGASAAPPAPEPGEAGELAARLTLISEGMSAMDQEEDSWFVARAATVIQQQAAELAALRGVPVAPSPLIVRYEFEVLDEHDQTVASGDASTLEEVAREGRHYLSEYQQDGPCTLELRRVEVLSLDAITLPAPQVGEVQP